MVVGVVFGWCMGEKGRRWEEERVYGTGKMGERGRENDLKAGHARPKNEYIRTYISTFDRTYAECMGVK
jgi:hypothetical protein